MVTSFLVRGSHREVSNMNTAQNKNGYFILISGTIAAFNIVFFFFLIHFWIAFSVRKASRPHEVFFFLILYYSLSNAYFMLGIGSLPAVKSRFVGHVNANGGG